MGLASGAKGIRQTLEHMRRFVRAAKTEPDIREKALQLINDVPPKDWKGEIEALFYFVQRGIRYTRDIDGVETVQTPRRTLYYGQGDCDDKVTLLAALLGSIGYRTRFRAIGFSPGHYSHVLLQVEMPNNGNLHSEQWVDLETTEFVPMGWGPPNVKAEILVMNGE